eukprot:TRINITY_DN7301_c0_g1_i1.p1 TRINITY_DN7301_c0_g1~~TRINITY_DN7301_c0_g1_i1.p1  ORF type:complete len:723 (+),score=140.47 TRINITY_DN7301_c0_g1_i1:151-2319(+)
MEDLQVLQGMIDDTSSSPIWTPVDFFRVLYCTVIAGMVIVHHAGHASFYSWFEGSGLRKKENVGLVPWPRLTLAQFHLSGAALVSALGLACFDGVAPRFFVWMSFGLYFIYFSVLFRESKAGWHSTMIPTVLFMLGLATPQSTAIWPIEVLKLSVALAHSAAGICKLASSVYFGRFWGSGPTLQYYIYEAMWTRPGQHWIVRWAQNKLIQRPYACTLLGSLSLAIEVSFLPCLLFAPHWISVGIGTVIAAIFYGGIQLVMGLDFLSYWCPVLLAFVAKDASTMLNAMNTGSSMFAAVQQVTAAPSTGGSALQALWSGVHEQPLALALAVLYVLCQVAVSCTFRDVLGEEKLAFSCSPMFFFPRNLFSASPKMFCLSGAKWRTAGFLDCSWMYNPQVFSQTFDMGEEDMARFNFPVIKFGTLAAAPDTVKLEGVKLEDRKKPFMLFSNILEQVGPELRLRLEELVAEFREADEKDAWCPKKIKRILDLQKQCRNLFQESTKRIIGLRTTDSTDNDEETSPRDLKKDKETSELPPPSQKVVSWAIMTAYFSVMAEAIWVLSQPYSPEWTLQCGYHLCTIYVVEVIMATVFGVCAMKGWKVADVLVHHVPYCLAMVTGLATGCWVDWTWSMRVSYLTAANEGLLVAVALGAPEWLGKLRRLYGFTIVMSLFLVETGNYLSNMARHWQRGDSIFQALPEQCVLGAVYYHWLLMMAYIKRWKKCKRI